MDSVGRKRKINLRNIIMSITVKVFPEDKARAEIKKCPKIVRDYFKKLKEVSDNWQRLCGEAIGKLKAQAKIIDANSPDDAIKFYRWMEKSEWVELTYSPDGLGNGEIKRFVKGKRDQFQYGKTIEQLYEIFKQESQQ
jgi:NAD-specific glutamate dehydrogenase